MKSSYFKKCFFSYYIHIYIVNINYHLYTCIIFYFNDRHQKGTKIKYNNTFQYLFTLLFLINQNIKDIL